MRVCRVVSHDRFNQLCIVHYQGAWPCGEGSRGNLAPGPSAMHEFTSLFRLVRDENKSVDP